MNPMALREMTMAFQKSRIVLTAYELDLFTFIGKNDYNSETISKALNSHKNATERLLNALVALNLLIKTNGKYSNTKESYQQLSKDSPDYLGGLMHMNHLWHTWSQLTDVVKTGKPAQATEINQRGNEWLEAFISAMHDRGKKQAPSQISKLNLQNVESVLDVGGGSGCFSMEFIKRKPDLKAAIFDLPNVIPISKRIVEEEGFSGKIEHYSGDYTRDELPLDFDLIFLSAIIHSNSYETNQALVKKCYNSLNAGGQIIIQDWIMNDAKTEPAQGAIFSINMLVGVEGGNCYSENEVSQWMKKAGFTDISKRVLESDIAQVIGFKKN
ncbi:methyltransferase domain-containing protein [Ancylomarina salipaludis]|uniref:Methyltransferase domain-containing protein n=1 Tax=Ancylomarina salipaludis TaxID=2501299 RepID=A0A4Q1JMN4_9BACT|nr:methyltransferase [Ancylomarina salipaludis]RXQ95860.1 methyltransferase domain-containing protein [Ancylomarina salipaludis]